MKSTRLHRPAAHALSWRSLTAASMVLILLPAVWSQTLAVNPVQAKDAREKSAPSSGRNTYQAGASVQLATPVKGDFYAVGGHVAVDQIVSGDATLVGGAVTVRAPIGEDLRAAGGDIKIESTVGGELYASGGNITLSNTAVVADAVTLYAGSVTIEGRINGPLKVHAQKIVLNGEVARDAELNAEQIELGPRAKLGGALRYSSSAQFKTAEGVMIGGAITRGDAMNGRPDMHRDREWHGQIMRDGTGWTGTIASVTISLVALLAAAALFLIIFTGFSRRASSRVLKTPWPALAAGVAVLLGIPIFATLLCITLIGIPLGIVLMMLFPLMLLMGWIVGIFSIAQWAQRAVQKGEPNGSNAKMIGFFALTLLLVILVGSLPYIGLLILFTILLLGTGACALQVYRQIRPSHGLAEPGALGSASMLRTTLVDTP